MNKQLPNIPHCRVTKQLAGRMWLTQFCVALKVLTIGRYILILDYFVEYFGGFNVTALVVKSAVYATEHAVFVIQSSFKYYGVLQVQGNCQHNFKVKCVPRENLETMLQFTFISPTHALMSHTISMLIY